MPQPSPERSRHGSPNGMEDNRSRQSPGGGGGTCGSGRNGHSQDSEEVYLEIGNVFELTNRILCSPSGWSGATAATCAWLSCFDSTNWSHAQMVLGSMSAFGGRLPSIPEDGSTSSQPVNPTEYRRPAASEPVIRQRSSARLYFYGRRVALRAGRLQCTFLAGHGLEHARSPLVSTHSRAGANAIVLHDSGFGLSIIPTSPRKRSLTHSV